MSDQTIYNYCTRGMPHTRDADGMFRFVLRRCEQWRARTIAPTGHGGKRTGAGRRTRGGAKGAKRRAVEVRGELPIVAAAQADKEMREKIARGEIPDPAIANLAAEVLREKKLKSDILQHEFDEMRGRLVDRQRVLRDLVAVLVKSQKLLSRIGHRAAPRVLSAAAGAIDPGLQATIQRAIQEEVDDVMDLLAKLPEESGLLSHEEKSVRSGDEPSEEAA